MYNVGDKVNVFYSGFIVSRKEVMLMGEIIKITPKGFLRIKTNNYADGQKGYNELFDPNTRMARGWNTLRFEPLL